MMNYHNLQCGITEFTAKWWQFSFLVPHQPRLDWQMWFAALGTYHNNAFFLSLAYHLLRNNSEGEYFSYNLKKHN